MTFLPVPSTHAVERYADTEHCFQEHGVLVQNEILTLDGQETGNESPARRGRRSRVQYGPAEGKAGWS